MMRIEMSRGEGGGTSIRLEVESAGALRTMSEHVGRIREALSQQGLGVDRIELARSEPGGEARDRDSAGRNPDERGASGRDGEGTGSQERNQRRDGEANAEEFGSPEEPEAAEADAESNPASQRQSGNGAEVDLAV
jgi:hypothetical protein